MNKMLRDEICKIGGPEAEDLKLILTHKSKLNNINNFRKLYIIKTTTFFKIDF